MRGFALLLCLLAGACRSQAIKDDDVADRKFYVSAGLSALPQVGVGVGGGGRVSARENYDLYLEGEGVVQFLNDTDFNDDGFGGPGNFYQVSFGLKHSFSPKSKRHLTVRYGGVWFQATGGQTILQQPGDYVGGYLGIGFETDLS